MRKTAVVFFTLLLVCASCFIAGCSSLPFSEETPAPATTPAKAIPAGQGSPDAAALESAALSQRFSFENVIADLALLDLKNPQSPDNLEIAEKSGSSGSGEVAGTAPEYPSPAVPVQKQIKQVRGGNLDEKGDAASWTFIVEHEGMVSVVSFSRRGASFSGSPGSVNLPEIVPDQILPPSGLVKKNHDIIFKTSHTGTGLTRDLSLVGNTYTITISSNRGPLESLDFNAKTGVLIS